MTFVGRVESRSSSTSARGGPPGESDVQKLNPGRTAKILAVTGWSTLASGSLNLGVDDSVLHGLAGRTPTLIEDAAEVAYPPRFAHIPAMRRAYWYYRGQATNRGVAANVLVRRAQVPVPGRVELFSEEPLRTILAVNDGDPLEVVILSEDQAGDGA